MERRSGNGIKIRNRLSNGASIYVPDVENSCAQFLRTYRKAAPKAYVLLGFKDLFYPETGEKYDEDPVLEERTCVWYLVERVNECGATL